MVLLACGGCAVPPPAPVVLPPAGKCPHVPPPRAQAPAAAVRSDFPQAWVAGHWDWNDGTYVWASGNWQPVLGGRPPLWSPGWWEAQRGACIWHSGHVYYPRSAKATRG